MHSVQEGFQVIDSFGNPYQTCPQDPDPKDETHCQETQESQEVDGARGENL